MVLMRKILAICSYFSSIVADNGTFPLNNQRSTKRKNATIALIIIAVVVLGSIIAVMLSYFLLPKDNVTISGEAYVSGALSLPPTTIVKIEFTDTQTGTVTAFHFDFVYNGQDHRSGNYSVILKNEHTYAVAITYYFDGDQINSDTTQIATFTVNATAGQKTINKDFG